jgi:hypothetical protein
MRSGEAAVKASSCPGGGGQFGDPQRHPQRERQFARGAGTADADDGEGRRPRADAGVGRDLEAAFGEGGGDAGRLAADRGDAGDDRERRRHRDRHHRPGRQFNACGDQFERPRRRGWRRLRLILVASPRGVRRRRGRGGRRLGNDDDGLVRLVALVRRVEHGQRDGVVAGVRVGVGHRPLRRDVAAEGGGAVAEAEREARGRAQRFAQGHMELDLDRFAFDRFGRRGEEKACGAAGVRTVARRRGGARHDRDRESAQQTDQYPETTR